MMDMFEIERDFSSMEPVLKPLLEAANTQHWLDALRILYLSGHITALSEVFQLPCLVSAVGPFDEVEHSIDLLKGKANVALMPLLKEAMRMFLPKFMAIYQKEEFITAINEEQQERFVMLLITEFSSEYNKFQNEIIKLLIQGASNISDMITIGSFNTLLEIRDKYIRSAFNEDEYEDMIEALLGLNLLESKLQLSLCPECANYQFMISRYPTLLDLCPKCGAEWATVTLYGLQHPYSEVKKENSDLPLFISTCLKHRMSAIAPIGEVKIYPLAQIKLDNGQTFDIDVYIPKFEVGIECKVFEDAYAPMTQQRLGSIVGRLTPQIKNYFDVGITKVFIITNLIESSKNNVESALKKKLIEEGYSDNIEILSKDIIQLLEWIDEKSKIMAKYIMDSFTKSLEQTTMPPSLPKDEPEKK